MCATMRSSEHKEYEVQIHKLMEESSSCGDLKQAKRNLLGDDFATKKVDLSKVILFLLIAFLSSGFLVLSTSAEPVNEANDEPVEVHLLVHVFDIDIHEKLATIRMKAWIDDFPYNETEVWVQISGGGGFIDVPCVNTRPSAANEWPYWGETSEITWFLDGFGEAFPFDSYRLYFKFGDISIVYDNFYLRSPAGAVFDGAKSPALVTVWMTDKGFLPIDYEETKAVCFVVQRTHSAIVVGVLQLLVPVVVCYYLLGATLMLDPKKQLPQRLAIHLSLFVFVPSFFIAIQGFLPCRSSLSLPEFLLTNLIISNTIFGIFSVIGNREALSEPTYVTKLWRGPSSAHMKKVLGLYNMWDWRASELALLVYAIVYGLTSTLTYTTYTRITYNPLMCSLAFSYVILPSFVYSIFIGISKEQIAKNLRYPGPHRTAILFIVLVAIILWIPLWISSI